MHERLKFGVKLALIGNALFIAFGLVCLFYYKTYNSESTFSKILEILAYLCEISGFLTLAYSDYLISTSIRDRFWLKLGFSVYIVLEAVMMIFELNSYHLDFYKPYSLGLAIFHALISAAVCFSFLLFDMHNSKYEAVIIICTGIIFGGMLGNIIGVRIYFSIIVNAISFTFLFFKTQKMLENEDIEIDCHGDPAHVATYSSNDFFKD